MTILHLCQRSYGTHSSPQQAKYRRTTDQQKILVGQETKLRSRNGNRFLGSPNIGEELNHSIFNCYANIDNLASIY